MAGRNDIANSGNGISDMDMKSLARTLFPIIRDYLLSEQGQNDYAEWKNRQLNTKLNKISDWNHTDAALPGRERNYAK